MKPCNQPHAIKPAARLLFLILIFASLTGSMHAQCSSVKNISYNITLTGTGNNSWGFSFPQFDPSAGTLMAVDIRSVVSLNYKFLLTNFDTATINYHVIIGRKDSIACSGLHTPIINTVNSSWGPYDLIPGADTTGAGTVSSPQYLPILRNYSINDSMTSGLSGFAGNGNVSFQYNPSSSASATGSSLYSIGGSASDTMVISINYYYCSSMPAANAATNFSATKASEELIQLQWETINEKEGRKYNVETSRDEKDFEDIATIPSAVDGSNTETYDYNYRVPPEQRGILYFRLKEWNTDGSFTYSEIKSVNMDKGSGIRIYPNPASQVLHLSFDDPVTDEYRVDILNSTGRQVMTKYVQNTAQAQIDLSSQLAKGVYFIKTTNRRTLKTTVLGFYIL